MTGKLKTKGNVMLATKLAAVLEVRRQEFGLGRSPSDTASRLPKARLSCRVYLSHHSFCSSRVVIKYHYTIYFCNR